MGRVAELRAGRDETATWLARPGVTGRRLGRQLRAVRDVSATGTRSGRAWSTRGVLIRETGPDGWLRVSIGTPQEMMVFRQALTEVLREEKD